MWSHTSYLTFVCVGLVVVQCEMIVEKYGVAHISAGDLLRAEVAAGTEAGKMAKKFMDNGDLVPDEVGGRGYFLAWRCMCDAGTDLRDLQSLTRRLTRVSRSW